MEAVYEMKYITKKAMENLKGSKYSFIPIVAISHPKTFGQSKSFEMFLSWISDQEDIELSSFSAIKEALN